MAGYRQKMTRACVRANTGWKCWFRSSVCVRIVEKISGRSARPMRKKKSTLRGVSFCFVERERVGMEKI